MEFEFSVQIIDKFIGGGLVFIYLAAFLILTIIVTVFIILTIHPQTITPVLKRYLHALKDAGFSEANTPIGKSDLSKLDNPVADSNLKSSKAEGDLKKAIEILQKIEENKEAKDAIALIGKAIEQQTEIQQDMQTVLTTLNPETPPTPPQSKGQWVVIVGSDPTPEAAKDEVDSAKKAGFNDAEIIFNKGRYRTVIRYESEEYAKAKLQDIEQKIRQGSYIRNLSIWCDELKESTPSESSVKYKKCT